MKLSTVQATVGSVLALMSAPVCQASEAHRHLHQLEKKHSHMHGRHSHENASVEKRGGSCKFPTDDDNLVAVTPGEMNAGWAMSPDQECTADSYCPYACKPGMVMAQWDPDSTYTYPASMNGGMYCNANGVAEKPFPNKPYCVQGTGAVKAVNSCKSKMSWCQTVLPGNEAMLIPTEVEDEAVIAVPDTSYWCETAAHFYLNPPGSSSADCIWGDASTAIGNWSPIVAGANTDANGQTFVKIGMNPIWESSLLSALAPSFGVKVECPDGNCNGLPCSIESGKVLSSDSASGAGGSDFCVVTVPKGSTAHIIAYDGSGGSGGSDDSDSSSSPEPPSSTSTPTPTPTPEPTTSTSTSTSTSTTPTSTSTPTPTPTPTSTSTSSTPTPTSTSKKSTSKSSSQSKTSKTSKTKAHYPTMAPGIFQENGTSSSGQASHSSVMPPPPADTASSSDATATTTDKDSEAGRRQSSAAMISLVVAFVAAACFF